MKRPDRLTSRPRKGKPRCKRCHEVLGTKQLEPTVLLWVCTKCGWEKLWSTPKKVTDKEG